jgi:superfamily II helicase
MVGLITANSGQQVADSRQQIEIGRQRTPDSGQQTTDKKHQKTECGYAESMGRQKLCKHCLHQDDVAWVWVGIEDSELKQFIAVHL